MQDLARNDERPTTGGGAGGVRRSRERLVRAVALLALLAALTAGGTAAASGAPQTPTPTPSPIPSGAPAAAPTVDTPPFSTDGAITVTGTRAPGADVQVTIASVPAAVTLPSSTTWRATATGVPDGQSPIRAVASGQEATATASVLRAPGVNSYSVVTTGLVSGTGYPGAIVDARSGSAACRATVGASSTWACLLAPPPPSGTGVPVTATQSTPWSSGTPAVGRGTGNFDTTAPGAAVITAPAAGATVDTTGITISGTSDEDGTTVRAYLSGYGDSACQAQVSGGRWSCTTGTLPPGALGITATVTDPLGNISTLAPEVRVTVAAPAASPTPGATPTPTPAPGATSSPESTRSAPAPAPGSGSGGGGAAGSAPGQDPAPGSGSAPAPAAPGTWNAPTRFGTSLQPLPAAFTDGRGLLPLLLALGAVLLVTLPALLLRGALIARFGGRHRAAEDVTPLRIVPRGDAGALTTRATAAAFTDSTATTGQMRIVPGRLDSAPIPVPARREQEPTLLGARPAHEPGRAGRWGAAAAALALAAALASLSLPVGSDPNAVRLFLAALVGLAVVNVVGVVAVASVAGRVGAGPARVRPVPALLVLSATAVLVSRGLGLAPPVVIGQVLGLVADDRDDRSRARLALVQSGSLATLGLLAWILYGMVPADGAMWPQLANELLSVITLAALSSAALALAPVSLVLGRSLLLRSLPLWAVVSVAVLTLAFAAVATTASGVPAGVWITSLVVAAAFAAVSIAVWLWIRVVEPSLQRS
ncbi:membrane protein [Clavibacter michiganensis]|uniref:membrane protein n=1 Tax=Clavibacter michiganensis TaxID=28447 RepID=UPI0005BAEC61|nr:membrane protein [Clavibacter michiganensis]